MPGPVALVGSGEYLPVMASFEAGLLEGRPRRYVQLPTAAGEEAPSSIAYWVDLGRKQAARLGVEAVPVLALDRERADDEGTAALIRGAGLIYLSGGSPRYVAQTLRDTRVWAAIVAEWTGGAALAGCSAGAMALTGWVPDIRKPSSEGVEGLGVVPQLRVLPHFDRIRARRPELMESLAHHPHREATTVGIDEDTAILSDGSDLRRWVVHGRQAAWHFTGDGLTMHMAGDVLLV